uniref:Uncharacterized protein n=1 Tax=Arundo donax TaxID=35708 RepID=A0A0A9BIH2_ARUDO
MGACSEVRNNIFQQRKGQPRIGEQGGR